MRKVCLAWCAACLVLLLGACRFPGAIRPTVKIGLVAPFEGRHRHMGYDVIYAVRLALREVNQAGGVGGYNVELVAYDDGASPEMALQQARALVVDPHVVVVIGHFRPETTAVASQVYATADLPLLSPGLVAPHADAIAEAWLGYLDLNGLDRAALVTEGGSLGQAVRPDARVATVVYPADSDWLSEVLVADPPVVLCDAASVTAGEVLLALRAAGWGGDFVGGPGLADPDFTALAGGALDEVRFVTPWPFPADLVGQEEFAAAYQAMGPHVPDPGPRSLPAYQATWRVLRALERDIAANGAPTREGMASALTAGEASPVALYWYRSGRLVGD